MKELKKYAKIVYASDGIDVAETVELSGVDDEQVVQDKIRQIAQFADTADFRVLYEYTLREPAAGSIA